MAFQRNLWLDDQGQDDELAPPLPAPGRRTLTQRLIVQRRRGSGSDPLAAAPARPGAPAAAASRPTDDPFGLHLEPSGAGSPLPGPVRTSMETAFGTDFSSVRVHQDGAAERIGALAYARGDDLHFAPGEYQPNTSSGRELLGHELTHVVQQRAGAIITQGKQAVVIESDPALEREADQLGARAAAGERVQVGGATARGSLQARWANEVADPDDSGRRWRYWIPEPSDLEQRAEGWYRHEGASVTLVSGSDVPAPVAAQTPPRSAAAPAPAPAPSAPAGPASSAPQPGPAPSSPGPAPARPASSPQPASTSAALASGPASSADAERERRIQIGKQGGAPRMDARTWARLGAAAGDHALQCDLVVGWLAEELQIPDQWRAVLAGRLTPETIATLIRTEQLLGPAADFVVEFRRGLRDGGRYMDLVTDDFATRPQLGAFLNPGGDNHLAAYGNVGRADKGETQQVLSDLSGQPPASVRGLQKASGANVKKVGEVTAALVGQVRDASRGVVLTLLGNTDQDGALWQLFDAETLCAAVEGLLARVRATIPPPRAPSAPASSAAAAAASGVERKGETKHGARDDEDDDGAAEAGPEHLQLVQINLLGCQTERLAIALSRHFRGVLVTCMQRGWMLEPTNGLNLSPGSALVAKSDSREAPRIESYKPHLLELLDGRLVQTFADFLDHGPADAPLPPEPARPPALAGSSAPAADSSAIARAGVPSSGAVAQPSEPAAPRSAPAPASAPQPSASASAPAPQPSAPAPASAPQPSAPAASARAGRPDVALGPGQQLVALADLQAELELDAPPQLHVQLMSMQTFETIVVLAYPAPGWATIRRG